MANDMKERMERMIGRNLDAEWQSAVHFGTVDAVFTILKRREDLTTERLLDELDRSQGANAHAAAEYIRELIAEPSDPGGRATST